MVCTKSVLSELGRDALARDDSKSHEDFKKFAGKYDRCVLVWFYGHVWLRRRNDLSYLALFAKIIEEDEMTGWCVTALIAICVINARFCVELGSLEQFPNLRTKNG